MNAINRIYTGNKLTNGIHFRMKDGVARLFQCSKQCKIAIEVFAGNTPVAVQHILQAAVQTIDRIQMVSSVIILVGFQYDLLTLFCMDKLVICPFSIAQKDSGFTDSRRKGFFNVLSTWISAIDTTYNDASVSVSSSTNTKMLIRKASFCCCFAVLSGFWGLPESLSEIPARMPRLLR